MNSEKQVIGKGITVEVKDNQVIVSFPLTGDYGLSGSGKSQIVASTGGSVQVPGTDVIIGVNAYRKAK